METTKRFTAIGITLTLLATSLAFLPGTSAAAQDGPMKVTSFDGTQIDILVCKPAGASAANTAPVILHSHGWGGSRAGNCNGFNNWLNAGMGVVSISQRGFGASGGKAHVHDPEFEGRDNIAVIDLVASFEWVKLDGANDPVLGAIGGSYGGGYQFITALTETAATGSTRFNALAPEITWYDLVDSLAPGDVLRTVWVSALYAVGAGNVHDGIHQAYSYAMATGQLPDGTAPGVYNIVDDFAGNSPRGFVDIGVQLDIPVLMRQGMTDTLFNFNQAWGNYENTLTTSAKAQSYVIGYNGGHVLAPSVVPLGVNPGGDPCSAPFGGFEALSIAFYRNAFFGESNPMPAKAYNLATTSNTCVSVDSVAPTMSVALDLPIVTSTGAGAPQHIALATGPLTIAGVGHLSATLFSAGIDTRSFLALSVGANPLTATMIDNQLMPVRSVLPSLGERIDVDLAGVAAVVPAGQTLYLTVTPVSDMSGAHGSRSAGAMVFTDVVVDLPVV